MVLVEPRGRVNLVEPGWTVTPMAEAALARHLTGQTLVVARGMEGRTLW